MTSLVTRTKSTGVQDALLNRSLRLTVVGTIAILGLICLILAYQGCFDVIAGAYQSAIQKMTWGAAMALGALLLIRYRGDLIDD